MIMIDQKRNMEHYATRQENRRMVKFIGKVALLLVLVTCANQWFLV